MKLDKELVREILLAVEASETLPIQWVTLDLPRRTLQETSYHVMLLDKAGLLEGQKLTTSDDFEWQPKRLTYRGHGFLDTIRDGEIWLRTKAGAEKAGGASIGFLWELAKAYGKQVASERLGISLE